MVTVDEIVAQYAKLATWCDSYFNSIQTKFAKDIACKPGCGGCCILRSISVVEAVVILNHLYQCSTVSRRPQPIKVPERRGSCPFLKDNCCSIYSVRPIICRTHGAPIRVGGQTTYDCCPLNFSRKNSARPAQNNVLDIDIINQNLARLNVALSLQTSRGKRLLQKRFLMKDIYHRNIPQYLQRIITLLPKSKQ